MGEAKRRRRCWAETAGGCAGPFSREHIISASVLGDDTFTLVTPFFNSGGKRWSANALAANILCQRHNSLLSPLDEEAGRLADGLRSWWRGDGLISDLKIDLPVYERWTLKVLINVHSAGWATGKRGSLVPPKELVEFILNGAPSPTNIYAIARPEMSNLATGQHGWHVLTSNDDGSVCGIVLSMLGFTTATIIPKGDAKQMLEECFRRSPEFENATIMRNPKQFKYETAVGDERQRKLVIDF
jgi:hypothetical protein